MSAERDHSEEYRRALVDEALTRTPRGGFPELEEREGLDPGALFDWVYAYGPRRELPFSSLHFWIGTTSLSEAYFWRYFEHSDAYWELEVDEVEATADVVAAACVERDFTAANAAFVYADPQLEVPDPDRLFNGPPYLGKFRSQEIDA